MVAVRRLKKILLLAFILCFGLLFFYARSKTKLTDSRPRAESSMLEQMSTTRSTEKERDSIDWTQQPGKPGDAWDEHEQGLDDHEDVQETLQWLNRVGTKAPDSETNFEDLRPTEQLVDNQATSAGSEALRTTQLQHPDVQATDRVMILPKQTRSQQHMANKGASTAESSLPSSENPTEEDEESAHESTTISPPSETAGRDQTTNKEDVSSEGQRTEKPTITHSGTTKKLGVTGEASRNEQKSSGTQEAGGKTTAEAILVPSTPQMRASVPGGSPQSTRSKTSVENRPATDPSSDETTTPSYTVSTATPYTTASRTTAAATPSNDAQEGSTIAYTPAPPENACRLPKLDPWDPSIKHLLSDVGFDPGCEGRYPPALFEVVSNKLVKLTNSDEIDFNEVRIETIHRTPNTDTDFYYKDGGNPFNVSVGQTQISRAINSDYFRLKYKVKGETNNLVYFFARVAPQPVLRDTARTLRQHLPQLLDLNIYMIGFDSTSRANFLRKMPNSLAFLRNELSTFFFEGYSIIGDATTPALTALLTGKFVTDLPEGRRGWSNSKQIDDWPWIMKEYEKRGYITMYAEDDVPVSTFNLRLLGFKKPPTHHYIRPFWMAVERDGARDGPGVCSKATTMVNYTLEYLTSFHEAYPDSLKFAFSFMSYIAHAHPNHLSYADKDLLRFLRTFVRRRQHENTILIVFGDHGSRNDDVRDTIQGKLEERLPWLSISVPKWLRDKHPDVMRALAHNQHVIATPFDLHATLRHVLTFPDAQKNEKNAQSLFTKLDTKRTCSDAGE